MNYTKERLDASLRQAGLVLSESQLAQLWLFHGHLRKKNPSLNMTRIHSFEGMVRKHYIDSLLVPKLLAEAGIELSGRLLDLGTGAGFPGIPLAIACPKLQVLLAEGRKQRTDFLQEVIELLDLRNAEVFCGRVHAHQRHEAHFVITRAVESMKDTLRHTEGNTVSEAHFVFMKGPNCSEEIAEVQKQNRYHLLLDRNYVLPESEDQRRLVVWKARQSRSITSPENKKAKLLKSLLQSRGIKKENLCLVSGAKIVQELLLKYHQEGSKNDPSHKEGGPIEALIAHPGLALPTLPDGLPVWDLRPELFREIDSIGSNSPMLLYRPGPLPDWKTATLPDGLWVVLPLQDPSNLGAAIRSAVAFGATLILLSKEAAHPWHPKAIRASAGTSLSAPLARCPSIHELDPEMLAIRNNRHKKPNEKTAACGIFALDSNPNPGSKAVWDISFPKNSILLVGEEGQGIPDRLLATRISIPTEHVDSLNASVSLSIVLYEYRKKCYTNEP